MYYPNKYSIDYSTTKLNSRNVIEPDLKLYEEILGIQSPSGNEGNMIRFITNYISKRHPKAKVEQDKFGNLYVTKGELNEGEHFPCLVAHTDEVHKFDPDRVVVKAGDFFIGWNNKYGDRDGLGADDKNGIFIALTLLDYFDVVKLFFPVQEEVGLVGTSNCDMNWFKDVGYLMQCDRRGAADLISYTNGVDVSSFEFLLAIEDIMDSYDYEENMGTCTDIGGLVKQGVGVSACNISCGYWDEHSGDELTYIPAMTNCLNMVYFILLQCGLSKFEHVPTKKPYDGLSYTGGRGYDYYDDWDVPDYTFGAGEASAKEIDFNKLPPDDEYPCAKCDGANCLTCKAWE